MLVARQRHEVEFLPQVTEATNQAVVNFASVNAHWQMRKHQLNKGGASLPPKLGAVNVGVTLTHL
jgi:hypothetical protein